MLLLTTISLSLMLAPAEPDSLAAAELAELRTYLAELKAGRAGDAAKVERLAGVSFAGLQETIRTYVELKDPVAPQTHRAFQALLERISREALSPWSMIELYSPELAAFLVRPVSGHDLARRLFNRLRGSDEARLPYDLCVRLTPELSLRYLEDRKESGRVALLEAWNRRLARGRESRPIPDRDRWVKDIGRSFSLDQPAAELEASLRFLASWPTLRDDYRVALEKYLAHEKPEIVLAGLAVQHRASVRLDLNEKLIERWADNARIVEGALRNYAFDESTDRAATLRRLWAKLPAERVRARYQCLFAMGVHFRDNDAIALAAVKEESFELLDVALPVLKRGSPERAREAVRHVLDKSKRGHEEALRLAHEAKLRGFEEDAAKIALDAERDLVLRQTALTYLQESEGAVRRRLLPLLADAKDDLRLAAIRAFVHKTRLTDDDLREIGPTLVRVALSDKVMGHRQEAMYVLGRWAQPQTLEFFRKVLADNPSVVLTDGYYSDARYWQYRFRLMGLLGMARLGDKDAKPELLELHGKGSPAEKMDVLLAFLELGEAPSVAATDLESLEPRLVATAAQLIARHGSGEMKGAMRKKFEASPTWKLFRDSGIDDYNILRIAGLRDNP